MSDTTPTTPLSQRAYQSALQMHALEPGRYAKPDLADFAHLDASPAPADPAPTPPAEPPEPPAEPPAPAWDLSAFDGLPDDVRDAVRAGAAAHLGRAVLHAAAERLLVDAADVHLHVADPQRFVRDDGTVDADAITTALRDLVSARPYLARPETLVADDRRRPDPAGAGGGPPPATAVADVAAMMRDLGGRHVTTDPPS